MSKSQPDYAMVLEAVLITAREAAQQADVSRDAKLAYYDVLDVAKQTAESIGLTMADLGLAGFDPETLLVPVLAAF